MTNNNEVVMKPEMDGKTPNGKPCWLPGEELGRMMFECARGSWQESVVRNLICNGYIISYKADGSQLVGKAASYGSKYGRSLYNLTSRISKMLPGTLELKCEAVGPKGAFGYRLTI